MSDLTRRHLLGASAGIASAATLAACSPTAGQDPKGGTPTAATSASVASSADVEKAMNTETTLTFWTWLPDIKEEVALFMKAYPKITVNVENVGQGADHYRKMRTVLKAGSGAPDVAQVEFQYITSFLLTKNLLDLTPYGGAEMKDLFVDWTWQQVALYDGIWAVPQDSGPMGNLYREDLMSQAGASTPAATWEEYKAQAEMVRSKIPKSYISNLSPSQAGVIMAFLWQAGAKPFSFDGDKTVKINLTDETCTKVMAYWQDMVKNDLVSIDPDFTDPWYQALANGKYAGWPTAAWGPVFLQGTAKNTSGKWRAAKLPQWSSSDNVTGNWGGSTNAVLNTTENPIVAYEFAKWLNTNLESTSLFASKQFLFPTTKETLASDAFANAKSEFYGGQEVNKLFTEISDTVDPDFGWLPFMDFAYSSFTDTVGKAITDKGDFNAGMSSWESKLTEYAKSQGFTVNK